MSTVAPTGERLAYSPAEAGALLGLSRARMFQLLGEGVIPSVKIGRARCIRTEAIVGFLDALEAEQSGGAPDAA